MTTKWKKSVDFSLKRVQSSKKKWQQFSADSLIVVHDFRILSFDDLLRKYPTLSSFFWRDKGKMFAFYVHWSSKGCSVKVATPLLNIEITLEGGA